MPSQILAHGQLHEAVEGQRLGKGQEVNQQLLTITSALPLSNMDIQCTTITSRDGSVRYIKTDNQKTFGRMISARDSNKHTTAGLEALPRCTSLKPHVYVRHGTKG